MKVVKSPHHELLYCRPHDDMTGVSMVTDCPQLRRCSGLWEVMGLKDGGNAGAHHPAARGPERVRGQGLGSGSGPPEAEFELPFCLGTRR